MQRIAAGVVGDIYLLGLRDVAGDLMRKAPRGLIDLFADWDASFDTLAGVAQRAASLGPAVDEAGAPVHYLTPLQYPNKVMLTGTNYYDHLRAVGRTSFTKAFDIFDSDVHRTSKHQRPW